VNLVPHRPRQVREIISAAERIAGVIARESEQPIERVRADIERDLWMSADAAVAYGWGHGSSRVARVARRMRSQAQPGQCH